ncbi:unnamed protein product [Fraxinus pennsylvanica]|uniref:USP domain-containing protein n=1 Tax=Fraxinus pennsylvanica TaxID=56036 RepID=A0AAD1YU58_9LAMI|nr:unnamed protein product [Fraxinus pennsylvanica]
MGHKKRNLAPRSKSSQTPSEAAPSTAIVAVDGGAAFSDNIQNSTTYIAEKTEALNLESKNDANPSSYSTIKFECEKALTTLRRGNHTKALRLMKDLCSKHENSPHSALIHRVQGTVCVKVALIIDDPNAKQRHLKNAIESARKAMTLSPNSIEFAHFYANLLYEAANEGKEYEEVVQECERALAIENPVDPAKESLQEESQQKFSTSEARVAHVQSELKSLIQKSNIASISTWMKNLGNGEEKFRLIPIRRAAEDPMELRLVQARRPNEIKKATKTPEERRKEIEVRVAAARLLQQKSESPQLGNGENSNKLLDSGSGLGQRVAERRKNGNVRKNSSSAERRDWVRSYWNSTSLDGKKELLRVRILDLKAHFSLSKDSSASEVLNEALSFGESNKVWKFWKCCRCNEKFANAELYMQHVVQEHMGTLIPEMQMILPQAVENEWAEMLLDCSWKPLDLTAASRMLEKQSKSEVPDFHEDSYTRNDSDDSKECFVDSYCSEFEWESSIGKKKLGDNCNGSTEESREFEDVEWMHCNGDQGSKEILNNEKWPLSDDPERAKLLEKIHAIFQALIKQKYLASSHLRKVIHFAVEKLQGVFGSQLFNSNVDQTPLCICFLGASELKKILKFLQEISHSCGPGRYSDRNNPTSDLNSGMHDVDLETLIISPDASFLVLDEHFLPCKLSPSSCDDADSNGSSAAIASCVNFENGVVLDSDALLSWIFTSPSSGEQLASWKRAREEKVQQGMEILQLLEKEFYHLQGLCERKCEHSSYEEALQAVEDFCLEEGKKGDHITDFVRQSYDSVLRKRREELVERDNEMTTISNRFELDAITNVLKDAESLNANQFGFEETYTGVTSHLCDIESGEDDDWRMKDYLHQVDSCIEVAIQRQKEQVSIELSKIDARIMRIMTAMHQFKVKLEPAAADDFQTILVPLVKSFLRAQLEDMAEKDATEKSDAAREAFLAELALDFKKGVGGGENLKHVHEKTKDKKKNKDNRKNKDSKVIGCSELNMLCDQTSEEISLPNALDGDDPDAESSVAGNDDALRLQEEECRLNIELEAEERKLEETLEYQRRIENEAKQKHLEEQHKTISRTIPEKMEAVAILDTDLMHNYDVQYANERWTNGKETLIQKGEFTMDNGGIPKDGGLPSDRSSRRRGRRQKTPTRLSDGKYQPVSSEKQNTEVSQLRSTHTVPEGSYTGTKTLRQLQAEDDDEERFQADLKKAVRQSLDTFHAHRKLPLTSNSPMPQKKLPEISYTAVSSIEVLSDGVNGTDGYGTGLKNEVGEYNCFLNVIIQSLWHLRRFREEFLRSSSEHVHVGDPCVICALYDIFTALSKASIDTRREAVAPTSLRVALSNLYPDSNFFQEGQMNDASEVLGVVFDCLHQSFTPAPSVSDTESVDSNCVGSWDCTNGSCVAHTLFGMDVLERMNCYNCGLESRYLKYTSFFHNINASALRTMKAMCPETSFDKLLNLVEMNHQLACDPDDGGCGKLNYIHHILSAPSHVFTTVLGWQNTCESVEDITTTLAALSTEIDISVLYRGLDPKNKHCVVSVVCYYGQHYHCFAYSYDHEQWIMYDDKTVKVIGGWNDVLMMCEKGHLQPQVLFFEAVN